MNGLMTELSNEFGCDKSTYHQYTQIYPIFLDKFRNEDISFFEIGYGNGCSYRIWERYFSVAKIYSMDNNISLMTDRGEVFLGDQSIMSDLIEVSSKIDNCKIIIDDGSHNPGHQLMGFEFLFENLLQEGGVYIIEDIECSYWKPETKSEGSYNSGYVNIIDYFTKYNHAVNHHYNLHSNPLNIKTITFAPNCIVIQKGNEIDKIEREYRFKGFL